MQRCLRGTKKRLAACRPNLSSKRSVAAAGEEADATVNVTENHHLHKSHLFRLVLLLGLVAAEGKLLVVI